MPLQPQQRDEAAQSAREPGPALMGGGGWAPMPASPRAAGMDWPQRGRAWYGWQLLASDAMSFSLIGLGVGLASHSASDGDAVATVGLVGYGLVPPLIHVLHGRPGMAGASLGVRVLVPVLATWFGEQIQDCKPGTEEADTGFCAGPDTTAGLLLGLAMASAIDAGLFSWDNPKPEPRNTPRLSFTPVLSPDGKRAELRAFGRF